MTLLAAVDGSACPRSSECCPQSIGNTVRLQSEQLSAFVGIRRFDAARRCHSEDVRDRIACANRNSDAHSDHARHRIRVKKSRLSGGLRPPRAHRHPPINAFQQHAELGRRGCSTPVRRRRPNKAARLEPLRKQAKPLAIPPQHLQQITTPPAERKNLAAERIAPQLLLNQHGQAVKALAHVGNARGKPHARSGRRRNHRPASAVNTRRNGSTSTPLPTLITTPLGSRISMCCSTFADALATLSAASRTGTKPPSPSQPPIAAANN